MPSKEKRVPDASSRAISATLGLWTIVATVLAVGAQLTLVWGFEFFPSVDGPAHVHLAYAMHEALHGDAFYRSLVEFNDRFNPNMATQAVLLALMSIAPPFVAEKIWLSLYFVGFALAGVYSLSGINRHSVCLLPLLLFCSISFSLAFGFYNFTFSAVIFLAWIGYWWRYRETFGFKVILGHALLAAIAYATHIFAFVVSLLGIAAVSFGTLASEACRDWQHARLDRHKWWHLILSHTAAPLLGALPELAASMYFLFVRFATKTAQGTASLGIAIGDRFSDLLGATSFAPYDQKEFPAAFAFSLTVLGLALYSFRRRDSAKGHLPFAVCFALLLIVYLLMPDQWIVRWMPARFQPFVFVSLILWLAALLPKPLSHRHWTMIAISGLLLLILSVAVRLTIFARLDDYYREYASAGPYIRERSTLIGLRLHDRLDGQPFPAKVDILIQAASRLASVRHSVDLKNFQAQGNDHPIQFRAGVSATSALGGDAAITGLPPRINLMKYEESTGRPIDYVLFYGFRDAVENRRALARIDAQLSQGYRLIYVSAPTGLVHLYQRTPLDNPKSHLVEHK